MRNNQALVKLATIRLAINHVLRQRMSKKATVESNYTIPVWASNPYDNGDAYYRVNENGTRSYYRDADDLVTHTNYPNLPTRRGFVNDLPLTYKIDPARAITKDMVEEGALRKITPPAMPKPKLPIRPIGVRNIMPEESTPSIYRIKPTR